MNQILLLDICHVILFQEKCSFIFFRFPEIHCNCLFFSTYFICIQQQDQLKQLKDNQITQEDFHAKQIKEHEEALQRHKDALTNIKK